MLWCFGLHPHSHPPPPPPTDRQPAGVLRSREEGERPDWVAAAGLGSGAEPVTSTSQPEKNSSETLDSNQI